MTKWHLYEGKETLDYSDDGSADDDTRTVILLWWYGGSEECHLDYATVVYRDGTDFSAVGGDWILALFR